MRLIPYLFTWAALAVVVLVLAVRRWMVTRHEDEGLHLAAGEASLIAKQVATERTVRTIDRWGEALTVIAILYGLTLLGIYLYGVWLAGNKPVL
jgi:hypothetical protein